MRPVRLCELRWQTRGNIFNGTAPNSDAVLISRPFAQIVSILSRTTRQSSCAVTSKDEKEEVSVPAISENAECHYLLQ